MHWESASLLVLPNRCVDSPASQSRMHDWHTWLINTTHLLALTNAVEI